MRKLLPSSINASVAARVIAVLLVASVGLAPASAEPLWKLITSGQRVEANPELDYRLREENGPWSVLATTFSGEGAEKQVKELILELRRRYKLEAYQHEMSFDFSQGAGTGGVDRYGDPIQMQYQKNRKIREIAVLVGNFPSVDDPLAQKTLKRIKTLLPDALDVESRRQTNQTLAAMRKLQSAFRSRVDPRKRQGPMGHAFITRNPLLPQDYFVPTGVDKFVEQMNRGVKHSLLSCKGQYTVKVATFGGRVTLESARRSSSSKQNKSSRNPLEVAADNAHRLTLALREKGWDAYEFHDRYESIVTVGSLDKEGTPIHSGDNAGPLPPSVNTIVRTFGARHGRSNFHPQADRFKAEEIKQTFYSAMASSGAQIASGLEPKSLVNIPFDIDPQVIPVPKRSISSAYVRRVGR